MPIAIILMLLVGGGTSVAAETSLPGDFLYPIKININENIRSAVAISTESQARWDTRRLEKRIEEVEKLAEQGRLDDKNTLGVQASMDTIAQDLENNVAKLSDDKNYAAAEDVNSNLGASIDAHHDILIKLSQKNATLANKLDPILLKLNAYSDSSERSRIESESKISLSSGVEVQAAAEGKMKAAQNKIDEVTKFLAEQKTKVSADVYASAEAKLDIAKQTMIEGNAYLSAKNYSSAFSSFQQASRKAQESKSTLTANLNLNIKLDITGDVNENNDKNDSKELENKERPTESGGSIEIKTNTEVKSDDNSTNTETNSSLKVKIGL